MVSFVKLDPAVSGDQFRPAQQGRHAPPRKSDVLAGYAFVAPAVLFFTVFIVGPLVATIFLAFFDWNLLGAIEFAGLENFIRIATDPTLAKALGNTFIFAIGSVVTHVGFGLLLALAVNRRIGKFARYWLRTAVFLPFLISWAATALLWKYILDPNFGFITYYFQQIGIDPPNWLLNPGWAMVSIIFVDWWHTVGFTFVILLAGLQTVPPVLHEAAMMDGAGPVRRFWSITLPSMSPTLFFALIISFIGAFQVFEPMFIMTNGGPDDSTLSIVMYVYRQAFQRFDIGYGAAVSIVVFIVIAIVTLIQFRVSRRWVHQ